MSDEKKYWIGFNRVKGIGSVRFKQIQAHFGDLSTAWHAPIEIFREIGLPDKVVTNIFELRRSLDLDRYYEQVLQGDAHVLTLLDQDYPRLLKEIDQAPPVIYVRGSLLPADEFAVAMVGTRRVTAYGQQVTRDTSTYLAGHGLTIVSGLARGVDALAHQHALQAGGRTIAVLGCGVDVIYPPEHRQLAEAIVENGALISDYPLGTQPEGSNFPPRNRVISGLSLATIVVEAGERSGALITADFAVEQGRDVFAVPGNVFSPASRGTNRLIQKGAYVLVSPQDVLDLLDLSQVEDYKDARQVLPADTTEAKILQVMDYEPIHIDELCNKTGLPVENVSASLTMMELKGMVQHVGGMRYAAIRDMSGK
ncbi:MAG TPA: DNA-processing protein DprA [Brevefilum sp.]|nr:DNA-processing protein DprA [Brevefilum sp.]HOR20136.1 DNA-processing protein DprA [Brevefilum sp.]HPL70175.1 DNA-processing protein DprA [Brevefilum sp.]